MSSAIAAWAAAGRPEEVWGLLVGVRRGCEVAVDALVPLPNLARDRRRSWKGDPRALLGVEDGLGPGRAVVGFLHTHPAGEALPSPADRANARRWPDLLHGIVQVGPDDVGPLRFHGAELDWTESAAAGPDR